MEARIKISHAFHGRTGSACSPTRVVETVFGELVTWVNHMCQSASAAEPFSMWVRAAQGSECGGKKNTLLALFLVRFGQTFQNFVGK